MFQSLKDKIKNSKITTKEDALKEKEKKITTDNILDVFSKDMMVEKKNELKDSLKEKDPVLYLNKATGLLKFGFFICLFFWLVLSAYWYIQKNEDAGNISILEPICFMFLWKEVATEYDWCSSVAGAQKFYDQELKNVKKEQSEKVLSVLERVYSLENFLFSEDIAFILEKSSSKLPVIEILTEFNDLKTAFEPIKKVYSIECNDIEINSSLELNISCSAYSSDWSDSNIMWFNGQTNSSKISGTSISVASSFVNFLKKRAENFHIVESTKIYSFSTNIEEEKQRYTKKTDFDISLRYINHLSE
jgi:hypothetical protein